MMPTTDRQAAILRALARTRLPLTPGEVAAAAALPGGACDRAEALVELQELRGRSLAVQPVPGYWVATIQGREAAGRAAPVAAPVRRCQPRG